ncbi:MAG: hypothetical protein J6J60_04845 [Clostridia bacterium]|nr:hypothetical protein [Clostridia bacterium]
MENATQALFMAAGVLIALAVISLGIMFFSSASSIGESYELKMSAVEIQKFNNQFEKFSKQPQYVGSENVFCDYNSISDVVSAINLAHNINSNNQYEQDVGIQVCISGLNAVDRDIPKMVGINPSIQKYCKKNNINDNHCVYDLKNSDKEIYDDSYCITVTTTENLIDLNKLLQMFNISKLNDNNERIYKYGFKGETKFNSKTGLIDIVKFELEENMNFE